MGSTPRAEVILVAWDPESPEHVDRLYQQRVACGWEEEEVEGWRNLQRSGEKTVQWVLLTDSDPSKEAKLAQHVKAWPLEAKPIADTATSLGGKPREPSPAYTFTPVGHISLAARSDGDGTESYSISTFYISTALQSGGLGRAAMDAIEHMAISEPLCATSLWLRTVADVQTDFRLQDLKILQSREAWYGRRGYKAYKIESRCWSHPDPAGVMKWVDAVYMSKTIT